jgi:predicted dinucleotide-binding enzyme
VKIGIIGAGRMGGTLAVLLAHAGHTVFPANSRGAESLGDLVAEAGRNAHATTPEAAAREGELVIVALPWGHRDALPAPDLVEGKVVVDAMNAFGHGAADGVTSSEQTAQALPGARVVKAFNTLNFATMRTAAGRAGDDRLSLFVAGDDAKAKHVVAGLMADMGFAAVDSGPLREGGRRQQPGGPVFNKKLTEHQARDLLQLA